MAEGDTYELGPILRTRYFSTGWIPYLGRSNINVEDTSNFGSLLFFSGHFGGGNDWKFDWQASFSFAQNLTKDSGDNKDRFLFACTTNCNASNKFTGDSARDFTIHRQHWNYALMISYLSPGTGKIGIVVNAGLAYNHEMRDQSKGLVRPQAGVKVIF